MALISTQGIKIFVPWFLFGAGYTLAGGAIFVSLRGVVMDAFTSQMQLQGAHAAAWTVVSHLAFALTVALVVIFILGAFLENYRSRYHRLVDTYNQGNRG